MKVKELFNSPKRWQQYSNACDKDKKTVPPESAQAVSWCLFGAVIKCYGPSKTKKVLGKIRRALPADHISISGFNDATNYQAVKELVDKLDI